MFALELVEQSSDLTIQIDVAAARKTHLWQAKDTAA